jgi:UDP-N-acetylmuramate dehydrogenase
MITIRKNVDLQSFNSFHVPAHAAQLIAITSEEMLQQLFDQQLLPKERLVLGGGSNILFTQDVDCLVLKMELKGLSFVPQSDGTVHLMAAAGEVWNDVVQYSVQQDLSGIENLALIPGTAGAAPVQNIGAYGVELMDVFVECRAFDTLEGKYVTLQHADCGFAYRESIFKSSQKNRYIITQITLRLQQEFQPNISYQALADALQQQGILTPTLAQMAETVASIRTFKLPDPSEVGNAGSFFKNPVVRAEVHQNLLQKYPHMPSFPQAQGNYKIPAGWLIEQAGWKGHRDGDCGTWKNQALVLVNHGKATGQELFIYSEKIISDVQKKFGIKLEREVNIR